MTVHLGASMMGRIGWRRLETHANTITANVDFTNAPASREVTIQPSVPTVIAMGPISTTTSPSTDLPLDLTRTGGKGVVTVEIKPLNLDHPGDTLDFVGHSRFQHPTTGNRSYPAQPGSPLRSRTSMRLPVCLPGKSLNRLV
ncbi:MAG: hypothetical protein PHQ40_20095 [Anaerolineaceae bacterium]|nr:hypothetical protein [Anaerolineaceae bacterium]